MDKTDRNLLRLSGRLRALEQLMKVRLVEWASRCDDPLWCIDAARKGSMLTVQIQGRPIDEAADFEAAAMIDALNEIFDHARAELELIRARS